LKVNVSHDSLHYYPKDNPVAIQRGTVLNGMSVCPVRAVSSKQDGSFR